MQKWQKVLRKGIFPQWSDEVLGTLEAALATGDERLIQRETALPPILDYEPEAACLLGFAGWMQGCGTVRGVLDYVAVLCHESDKRMGHENSVMPLIDWWDETPRGLVCEGMLRELDRELERRTRKNREVI